MSEILSIGKRAQTAARKLRIADPQKRNDALMYMADELCKCSDAILAANKLDLEAAADMPQAFRKRLTVDEKVLQYMTARLKVAAELPDPAGEVLEEKTMPSGLLVRKVSVPIGVLAMIYEARPNVTSDAAAAAIKSGNAVILKGGSESLHTNKVIAEAMRKAIVRAGLPADAVQLIESSDRSAVTELLQLDGYIDLLIPRGGKSLIQAIEGNTRIPILKHYDGICHLYAAADADIRMAVQIIVNSKCQNTAVCNALETLLIDAAAPRELYEAIAEELRKNNVELRGCAETCAVIPDCIAADESDWDAEYLAPVLAVRTVHGIEEAMEHIAAHGSGHTDGIITASETLAAEFIANVDSASVLVNASTRLSGGGDYGMGAVVGISTDRLHARGPVGPAELCTYKWVAIGNGQLRK